MKRLLVFVMMLALCLAGAAGAQEQKKTSLSDWLKSIQKKIDKILPKKEISTSTGVAGVRGAKQETQTRLYWKGKKGENAVTEEELTKFRACVELAGKGESGAATKELEAFMKQYPDSALIPDAKKTLDMVKAEPAAEQKPAVKEEPKAEEKAAEKKAAPTEEKKEEKKDGEKKAE
jgi:hypothetical protein